MKIAITAACAAAMLALTGCGGADDAAERNIEAMTENRADALEDQADLTTNAQLEEALEDNAEAIREMGEDKGDEADARDDARIEGQVANSM